MSPRETTPQRPASETESRTATEQLFTVAPLELPAPRPAARVLGLAEPPRTRRRAGVLAWNLLAHGARAGVFALLAWGLFFNFSEVRGSSMEPGIQDRDRILVDHVSYLFGEIERGDIIVLRYPLDPSLDYVKRVIGLPGEHVVIRDGDVWVDSEQLDEPYVAASSIDPYSQVDTTVAQGHCFVLGDNRLRSSDSREFGQVPIELVRGQVRVRLWPPERIGAID